MLDQGFLSAALRESPEVANATPTVQVLNIKKIQPSNASLQLDRYRLIVSDGVHYVQAMLATQLNPMCSDNILLKNGILKLQKFIINKVANKKILIILEAECLSPRDSTIQKFGNAVGWDDSAAPLAAAPGPNVVVSAPSVPVQPAPIAQSSFYGQQQQHQQQQPAFGSSLNVPHRPQADSNRSIFPISSLSPYQNKWTIRARAISKSPIRTWSNAKGEGRLFSVTLIDESGEIRVSGFNEAVDMFYETIQENAVYYVSGAAVKVARNRQYSNVQNEYEMTFDARTELTPCADSVAVPQIRYDFKALSTLMDIPKDSTIDILAIVKDCGAVSTIVSKSTQRPIIKRELTLVDESKFSVRATLWGSMAESFSTNAGNPLVAIKGVKVGDYGGRSLSVLNSSVLNLEPDTPEAHRLRGWYNAYGGEAHFENYGAAAGAAGGANRKEILKPISAIKEEGLGQNEKPDYISVRGHVCYVRDTLSYPACPGEGCNKKVTQEGAAWRCEKCNRSFPAPEYRYISSLCISDSTDQTWVQAFNEAGEVLMGMTAGELMKIKDDDEEKFNALKLDALWNRYNFRLKLKNETYNDESKVRASIMAVTPLDFTAESKRLVELIDAYKIGR